MEKSAATQLGRVTLAVVAYVFTAVLFVVGVPLWQGLVLALAPLAPLALYQVALVSVSRARTSTQLRAQLVGRILFGLYLALLLVFSFRRLSLWWE